MPPVRAAPLSGRRAQAGVFLASDAQALSPLARRVIHLQDGDQALITAGDLKVTGPEGRKRSRRAEAAPPAPSGAAKGRRRHFMGKEIHEQPQSAPPALSNLYLSPEGRAQLPEAAVPGRAGAAFAACGTGFYAALTAAWWMERFARLPAPRRDRLRIPHPPPRPAPRPAPCLHLPVGRDRRHHRRPRSLPGPGAEKSGPRQPVPTRVWPGWPTSSCR